MIPGIGVIGATAIEATVTDPAVFRLGRDFAAWIGVNSGHGAVPNSTSVEMLVKWGVAVHSQE
jgi:transposase